MRRPSWLMSSTTPSATRKSASLVRLQVEKGRSCSVGLDFAIFLISRRSGRVKVLGQPPLYFGYRESKPSVLKLWITSRTRSALVKVTSAIFATGMPWATAGPSGPAARSPLTRCPGGPSAAVVCLRHRRSRVHVPVLPPGQGDGHAPPGTAPGRRVTGQTLPDTALDAGNSEWVSGPSLALIGHSSSLRRSDLVIVVVTSRSVMRLWLRALPTGCGTSSSSSPGTPSSLLSRLRTCATMWAARFALHRSPGRSSPSSKATYA